MEARLAQMLARYAPKSKQEYLVALREILQEIALLGLWRSKFFDHAAFYGGTALRILHGLDRFSEDLDFSLLKPNPAFDLSRFRNGLEREMRAFGFSATFESKSKSTTSAIHSAFLKADTISQLILLNAEEDIVDQIPKGQVVRVKLEVDTFPPPGFTTEVRFLLRPFPFPVRAYSLPDLLAGKMHAALFRRRKNRVKGRDWYDLVWYATYHPKLHLGHLEKRMRQSGDWKAEEPLAKESFARIYSETVHRVDFDMARKEVEPFVKRPEDLAMWSRGFFEDLLGRFDLI